MRQFQLLGEKDIPALINFIKMWSTNKEYDADLDQLVLNEYTEFEPIMVEISEEPIREMANKFMLTKSGDEPYYTSVYYQFRHLIHMYNEGWITSPRQLVLTSKDCLSTIHLVVSENGLSLHCFQRSSNIDNALEEDIRFLCFLLMSVTKLKNVAIAPLWRDIKLFISLPHTFGNNKSKVEQ